MVRGIQALPRSLGAGVRSRFEPQATSSQRIRAAHHSCCFCCGTADLLIAFGLLLVFSCVCFSAVLPVSLRVVCIDAEGLGSASQTFAALLTAAASVAKSTCTVAQAWRMSRKVAVSAQFLR